MVIIIIIINFYLLYIFTKGLTDLQYQKRNLNNNIFYDFVQSFSVYLILI